MIRVTKWKPDTCGCIFEYSWDDSLPENKRVHTLMTVVESCDAHKGLIQNEHFNKVLEENQRKNRFISVVVDNTASMREDSLDEKGNAIKILKSDIEYKFSFDTNRILQVSFEGNVSLSKEQKDSLQVLGDSKVGVGKVKVN